MTANVGRLFYLEKDGNILAGLREVGASGNAAPIDITTMEDAGFRLLLEVSGEDSTDVSFSGVTKDAVLREAINNGTDLTLTNTKLVYPNGETLEGDWKLTNLDESGTYNDAVQFSGTIMSSGVLTQGSGYVPPTNWTNNTGSTNVIAGLDVQRIGGTGSSASYIDPTNYDLEAVNDYVLQVNYIEKPLVSGSVVWIGLVETSELGALDNNYTYTSQPIQTIMFGNYTGSIAGAFGRIQQGLRLTGNNNNDIVVAGGEPSNKSSLTFLFGLASGRFEIYDSLGTLLWDAAPDMAAFGGLTGDNYTLCTWLQAEAQTVAVFDKAQFTNTLPTGLPSGWKQIGEQ